MAKHKLSLLLLLLTFLSGDFNLNRFNIGINLEIKYVLFVLFLGTLLLPESELKTKEKLKFNKALIIFLSFIVMYYMISLFSIYYSTNPILASKKLGELAFLGILIISVVYIINKFEQEEYMSFVSTFFLVVGIMYVIPVILSSFLTLGKGRFALSGPNVTTRILFFALISCMYKFAKTDKVRFLFLIITFFAGIIIVGSRGGLLGVILALSMLFLCKKLPRIWKVNLKPTLKSRHILYTVIGAGSFYLFYNRAKDVFLNRFIKQTFGGTEIYTSGREVLYSLSFNLVRERPLLGFGLNGFEVATGRSYPHNLALELMNDIGIFGLLFFIAMLFFSITLIFKYRSSHIYMYSVLPLYMVVVQMFSGMIYDFRYFFLWSIPLVYFNLSDYGITDEKNEINIQKTTIDISQL